MAASEPIISVSGLRGTIGNQLTPVVAMQYVAALAATLPKGRVVVGRDGRSSGKILSQAVCSALAAHGITPVDLDVAATPTVGVAVRHFQAVAGVQISASHNPKEYNGLKLFSAEGRVLPKVEGEKVLAAYRSSSSNWVGVDDLGTLTQESDPHAPHLQLVLETIDPSPIREQKFKVLLDSNHGAGSLLGRRLLDALGCETTVLGDSPDGKFAHKPEPVAANLVDVSKQIVEGGFAAGFCQDPDADRLAVIDEKGEYIGEELTLALCLLQVLPQQKGTIVTNCATSSVSKSIAKQFGCELQQSAVGEANVCDLMLAENAVFGGEGNGGPIDPKVGYVRDSFVGMARILSLLAGSGKTISQHVAELPPLSIVKDKIDMDASNLPPLLEKLTEGMPDATASQPDGLKLDWGDRWLLVRGSNTEPIVRFIAEAPTTAEAQVLCDKAKDIAG
ncbi:MAG: phosphoglucosamine mutase [Planctomycetota bacterium]